MYQDWYLACSGILHFEKVQQGFSYRLSFEQAEFNYSSS